MSDLVANIQRKYGTVYRFCQRTGLPRSTVSEVLRGVYTGDADTQIRRIRAALVECDEHVELAFEAIRSVACDRCNVNRECHRCDAMFKAQARAVITNLRLGAKQ